MKLMTKSPHWILIFIQLIFSLIDVYCQKKNAWWIQESHFFHFRQKTRGCLLSIAFKQEWDDAAWSKFDSSQLTGNCWRTQFWLPSVGKAIQKATDLLTHPRSKTIMRAVFRTSTSTWWALITRSEILQPLERLSTYKEKFSVLLSC